MKSTIRMVVLGLVALAFLAAPAYANQVDVASVAGFGTLVSSSTSSLNTGPFSVDVATNVYFDSSTGVYTYVYALSNVVPTGVNPVFDFSINSGLFSSSLNWGVVGTPTGAVGLGGTTFGVSAPFCSNNGFAGCSSAVLNFTLQDGSGTGGSELNQGLNPGEAITLYAQSYGTPGTLPAIAIDHDSTQGNVVAPVPEPGTMALFGSGMIGLAFAIRRRLQG